MSFIQAAKLVIDVNDNIVESKLLDIEPFEVSYRQPSRCAPNIIPVQTETSNDTLAAIAEAENVLQKGYKFPESVSGPTNLPPTEPAFVSENPNERGEFNSSIVERIVVK